MEHSSFKMWQEQYMNRMGFVAGGLILSQTTLVGLQVWLTPSSTIYLTAAIVILMWLITGFISVPLHHKLIVSGHDAEVIRKLVQTNWLRTIGWSAIFFLGSGL